MYLPLDLEGYDDHQAHQSRSLVNQRLSIWMARIIFLPQSTRHLRISAHQHRPRVLACRRLHLLIYEIETVTGIEIEMMMEDGIPLETGEVHKMICEATRASRVIRIGGTERPAGLISDPRDAATRTIIGVVAEGTKMDSIRLDIDSSWEKTKAVETVVMRKLAASGCIQSFQHFL